MVHVVVGLVRLINIGLRAGWQKGAALKQGPFPDEGWPLRVIERLIIKAHQLPCWHAESLLYLHAHNMLYSWAQDTPTSTYLPVCFLAAASCL